MRNLIAPILLFLVSATATAQTFDAERFQALRDKARSGGLTTAERAELTAAAVDRKASYLERQGQSIERMRVMGVEALKAAEARKAPTGPAREFYVNNELGDDEANGLSASKTVQGGPVRTLAKAVTLLQPGDTLHLAVTNQPYRETLQLGDDFGGVPGKPITIDGHGATITGCDSLRFDGWEPAGAPGLYKSATFIDELEEFDDAAKLGRVYFVFDGVAQHMDRSMKGKKTHFKAPDDLQPGEWTFVEAERSFYLKVAGELKDAWIEAPYRRNGVAIRAPKIAATHLVIQNLIVCRVLNDGYNLHGTTKDVLLQNITALECGDDGISPHETCEVEIDGFWSVGNSTGMGNGYLSVTKARNVRLEGNLGHQLMTGHSPVTELTNALIVATPGTEPINITNSQDTKLKLTNVEIKSSAGQRVLLPAGSTCAANRITSSGATWEVGGRVEVQNSVIDGSIALTVTEKPGQWHAVNVVDGSTRPPSDVGFDPAEVRLPPKPVPHPAAGKFTTLEAVRE